MHSGSRLDELEQIRAAGNSPFGSCRNVLKSIGPVHLITERYSSKMRLSIRPIRGSWPSILETLAGRFFWGNPAVVLDESADPDSFRRAMAAFPVGNTFKITCADRHAIADALLMDNVDLQGATILDIGASDGTTAVDLISKILDFRTYIIADISLHMTAATVWRHLVFFDHRGECNLVVGRRLIAWPSLSSFVRLLYTPVIRRANRSSGRRESVLLLNPATRRVIDSDPRVSSATHDIFLPWPGPKPDVIKVANLLRRLYFDDTTLLKGLESVLANLAEGGHFLLVDNPRARVGPRAAVYRRTGDAFTFVAQTPDSPEIAELVAAVRLTPSAVRAPEHVRL